MEQPDQPRAEPTAAERAVSKAFWDGTDYFDFNVMTGEIHAAQEACRRAIAALRELPVAERMSAMGMARTDRALAGTVNVEGWYDPDA